MILNVIRDMNRYRSVKVRDGTIGLVQKTKISRSIGPGTTKLEGVQLKKEQMGLGPILTTKTSGPREPGGLNKGTGLRR